MAVLLIAELNGGELSVDSTAKALTAAKQMGEVTLLCVGSGCASAAEAAAKLEGVSKVLCAQNDAYGHDLAEPVAALIVSLASDYSHIVAPSTSASKNILPRVAALLDVIVLDDDNVGWVEGYVRWELGLLAAVGYRLDLARCVASGQTSDLAFVSQKSGGAVARHQAGSFASRMLALPMFLGGVSCEKHDWIAGLDLTGHFLSKRVFAAHNLDLPTQRKRLADMVDSRYNGNW